MSARMDRLEFYREVVDLGSGYVPGDWRWTLVAAENGKTIGASTEGYRRRIGAVRNAARVLGVDADYLIDEETKREAIRVLRRGVPLTVVVR